MEYDTWSEGDNVDSHHHDRYATLRSTLPPIFPSKPRLSQEIDLHGHTRMPHILIPTSKTTPSITDARHFAKIFSRYGIERVCFDDVGYYIIFEDSDRGRRLLQRCFRDNPRTTNVRGLFSRRMQCFPFGKRRDPLSDKHFLGLKKELDVDLGGQLDGASENLGPQFSALENSKRPVTSMEALEMTAAFNTRADSYDTATARLEVLSDPLRQSAGFYADFDDRASHRPSTAHSDMSSSASTSRRRRTCYICAKSSGLDAASLIACSTCRRHFHRGCHNPSMPLDTEAWKCYRCERKVKDRQSTHDSSRASDHISLLSPDPRSTDDVVDRYPLAALASEDPIPSEQVKAEKTKAPEIEKPEDASHILPSPIENDEAAKKADLTCSTPGINAQSRVGREIPETPEEEQHSVQSQSLPALVQSNPIDQTADTIEGEQSGISVVAPTTQTSLRNATAGLIYPNRTHEDCMIIDSTDNDKDRWHRAPSAVQNHAAGDVMMIDLTEDDDDPPNDVQDAVDEQTVVAPDSMAHTAHPTFDLSTKQKEQCSAADPIMTAHDSSELALKEAAKSRALAMMVDRGVQTMLVDHHERNEDSDVVMVDALHSRDDPIAGTTNGRPKGMTAEDHPNPDIPDATIHSGKDRHQRILDLLRTKYKPAFDSRTLPPFPPSGPSLEEIRKRPTRKHLFGKPANVSRVGPSLFEDKMRAIHAGLRRAASNGNGKSKTDRSAANDQEWSETAYAWEETAEVEDFESLDDLLGVPAICLPIIYDHQLVFREGAKVSHIMSRCCDRVISVLHGRV